MSYDKFKVNISEYSLSEREGHSLGARIALRRTEAEDLELDISKR